MCLAIPMKIVKIEGDMAIAEAKGVEMMVNISLMSDIKLDDDVIIHAGFVIEKLDGDEAYKINEIWQGYEESIKEE